MTISPGPGRSINAIPIITTVTPITLTTIRRIDLNAPPVRIDLLVGPGESDAKLTVMLSIYTYGLLSQTTHIHRMILENPDVHCFVSSDERFAEAAFQLKQPFLAPEFAAISSKPTG